MRTHSEMSVGNETQNHTQTLCVHCIYIQTCTVHCMYVSHFTVGEWAGYDSLQCGMTRVYYRWLVFPVIKDDVMMM